LCTLQTEDEKKIRRRRRRRRDVIRDIAFIVTGGNGKFTSVSVPMQCLLGWSPKYKRELPGKFRETNPHYTYRFSSDLTENNLYPLQIPSA
jgi:hypothetical protein